jgi:hypothetical protein
VGHGLDSKNALAFGMDLQRQRLRHRTLLVSLQKLVAGLSLVCLG